MTSILNNKLPQFLVMSMLAYSPLALYAAEFNTTPPSLESGLGAEFTTAFSRTINGRLGISAFDFDADRSAEQESDYSFDSGLSSWSALVDWHPFSGGFRFSGGLLHNQPVERQSVDRYTGLGLSNALSDNELGSLNGIVDIAGTAPYLGIGWGNALSRNGRLGLVVDLGLVLQDDADVNLSSDSVIRRGGSTSFNNVLDDYSYLPVFSFGLSYQFD